MFVFNLLLLLVTVVNCKYDGINSNSNSNSKQQPPQCGIKRPSVVSYIYGGKPSPIEAWPWQVHLRISDPNVLDDTNYDYANCGASILSDTWLLTAAHCFSDRKNPKLALLQGYNITRKNYYKEVKYDEIVLHPEYEEYISVNEYSTNDVALVKLSSRSRLRGRVSPVCIPEEDTMLPANAICYITGFGATSQDDKASVKRLREGKVVIKDDSACIRTLQLDFYDSKTMMCAGKTRNNRANSCQGDSGGPLMCEGNYDNSTTLRWYVFGVTSFGAADCAYFSNSVYTKVSSYVSWIRNVTGIKD